ncbi:transposase [Streptomyces sp. CA-243310]|uniref:transposase n=1 Tax=Streptomyces sp. CA-243310 TaxID=3240056 RepID=UPI003D8ED489
MHRVLLAELNAAGELDWSRVRGRFSCPREEGGADTGPSPVDRRKPGSKHHLICDGRGTPLKVITTAANVNDVTQTLALIDGIPPVAGRPGRPRRRPEALLGDKGYNSNPNRDALRKRRILPVISRRGCPNIKGLGKLRYVVEQTFALPPPLQTPRRPLGTPHRTPRRLHPPRLQPHPLQTPQERAIMIVLRVLGDPSSLVDRVRGRSMSPAFSLARSAGAGQRGLREVEAGSHVEVDLAQLPAERSP